MGGGSLVLTNPIHYGWMIYRKQLLEIISEEVNPAVASHGGHVNLIGVDEGKAIILLEEDAKGAEWLMLH